jgi:Holliday junction resolvasome RuvABC DNA-binding subunit
LQGVRDATPEAIAALPGFGQKTAERILEKLRSTAPTAPPTREAVADAVAVTTPIDLS